MSQIEFKEWQNLELKVGKIVDVERVPEADKLYRIMVDIGEDEPRQIVSGIVEYYTEDELKDKSIIVLTNLKPAKFRGVESNGMLLAATDEKNGNVTLLTPEKQTEPGTNIT